MDQATRFNDALKARLATSYLVLSRSHLVLVVVASDGLALANVEFLSRCQIKFIVYRSDCCRGYIAGCRLLRCDFKSFVNRLLKLSILLNLGWWLCGLCLFDFCLAVVAWEGEVLDVDDRRKLNSKALSVEPILAEIARNHVWSLWLLTDAVEGSRITGRNHKLVVWCCLVTDR